MNPSRRIYELTLLLFPDELRRKYGKDMADVFTAQLSEARGSIAASVHVWWAACSEILSIALPAQASNPALVAPMASLVTTGIVYVSLTWALENPLRLNSMYHAVVHRFIAR